MSDIRPIRLVNSLTGEKELFAPIIPQRIGMYVCGPTVYSDVHLGNCRTFVNFDIIYRFLMHVGYKVRYVRNITDVGHMLDDGEDRMSRGARANDLEPMEVAQKYTVGFHSILQTLNALPPSIEPRATGHIPEQIEMVKEIIDNGFAYEANGSVYFNVAAYSEKFKNYGALSGRILDDLLTDTRDNLKKQNEKRNPADFAIWMRASEEHIMRWNSPWSVGFPGWHLECSAMSRKYLGETFDIHGGGYDLKFPHHENEIAQNNGACSHAGARYWLHANMLLLNGKKMSKSDGNTISTQELFAGKSAHTSKAYSAMVVRFFFLQAHYRSTLDITDEALQAAEKGYKRLMEAYKLIGELKVSGKTATTNDEEILKTVEAAYAEMADDFNAPKAMARLFELCSTIYALKNNQLAADYITETTRIAIEKTFNDFIFSIFGLLDENSTQNSGAELSGVMQLVLDLRSKARTDKDWATSDKIRDDLKNVGIAIKDSKNESSWLRVD